MTRPEAPPVKRREIFGWAMFDFANSSYTTVVISFVYSAFFVGYIVPEDSAARDSLWALAIAVSTVIALLLSPLVGAVCDLSGRKKRFLIGSTALCSVGTALLALASPGQVWLAMALLIVSNVGFMLSETFCASFLTDLADDDNMSRISGLGWGVGYFGGLTSMVLITFVVITADPESALGAYVAQNRVAMVVVGAFFALAALPTFLLVRERSRPAPGYAAAGWGQLFSAGVRELSQAAVTVRAHPVLFRFLIAFTVYMAGLDAMIKFVGIYAKEEVQLSGGELTTLFLVLQLSAAAGAVGFGYLGRLLGEKSTVMLTLFWWMAAGLAIWGLTPLAAATDMNPKTLFMMIALMAGSGMGSIQASSRAVVGILAPPEKSAQMFGFWSLFLRLASILGMSYGVVSDVFGSRRDALLLVVAFFAVGAMLLAPVRIDEGRRATAA